VVLREKLHLLTRRQHPYHLRVLLGLPTHWHPSFEDHPVRLPCPWHRKLQYFLLLAGLHLFSVHHKLRCRFRLLSGHLPIGGVFLDFSSPKEPPPCSLHKWCRDGALQRCVQEPALLLIQATTSLCEPRKQRPVPTVFGHSQRARAGH